MFAGPNGSGKSTLKSYLPPVLLGIYLNPDEIEDEVRKCGFLDFSAFDVTTTGEEVLPFFIGSPVLKEMGLGDDAGSLRFLAGRLEFG